MNKKGQVLIGAVIMIPLVVIFVGGLIKIGSLYSQKREVLSVSKTIIANVIENPDKFAIIELYKDNDIKYKNIDIDLSNGVKIKLDMKDFKIKIWGYKDGGVLKYEEY